MLKNLILFATTRCDLKCAHDLRGYPTRHDDLPLDLLPNLMGRHASSAHSMLALAVLGRMGEQPLAQLIERWLRTCGDLQTERARCIADGEMGEGVNTCSFCHLIL